MKGQAAVDAVRQYIEGHQASSGEPLAVILRTYPPVEIARGRWDVTFLVRVHTGVLERWTIHAIKRTRKPYRFATGATRRVAVPDLEAMAIQIPKGNPPTTFRSVPAVGHGLAAIEREGFSHATFLKRATSSRGPVLVFTAWRNDEEYAINVGRLSGDRLQVLWQRR